MQKLANIIKDYFPNISIEYIDEDPFVPKRGTLNINKAKDLIGYNPKNSIETAYPKYIEWYKNLWKNIN